MPTKTYFVLALLPLSLPLPQATAQGNLVANGGFDTDASGWTTNASSGYYDRFKGNPGGCFTLTSPSTNTPMISQTINGLVPGSHYAISGTYSIEGGYIVSTPSLGVGINGVFLYQVAPPDYSWHSSTFEYTATSSSL